MKTFRQESYMLYVGTAREIKSFEKNLKWNGQTGDETVRGTYTFGSEDEKEDFNNSDVDDCYYWEIDEDTIVFYRTAG